MAVAVVVQDDSGTTLFTVTRPGLEHRHAVALGEDFGRTMGTMRAEEFANGLKASQPNFRAGQMDLFPDHRADYLLVHRVYAVVISQTTDNVFAASRLLADSAALLKAVCKSDQVTPADLRRRYAVVHLALVELLADSPLVPAVEAAAGSSKALGSLFDEDDVAKLAASVDDAASDAARVVHNDWAAALPAALLHSANVDAAKRLHITLPTSVAAAAASPERHRSRFDAFGPSFAPPMPAASPLETPKVKVASASTLFLHRPGALLSPSLARTADASPPGARQLAEATAVAAAAIPQRAPPPDAHAPPLVPLPTTAQTTSGSHSDLGSDSDPGSNSAVPPPQPRFELPPGVGFSLAPAPLPHSTSPDEPETASPDSDCDDNASSRGPLRFQSGDTEVGLDTDSGWSSDGEAAPVLALAVDEVVHAKWAGSGDEPAKVMLVGELSLTATAGPGKGPVLLAGLRVAFPSPAAELLGRILPNPKALVAEEGSQSAFVVPAGTTVAPDTRVVLLKYQVAAGPAAAALPLGLKVSARMLDASHGAAILSYTTPALGTARLASCSFKLSASAPMVAPQSKPAPTTTTAATLQYELPVPPPPGTAARILVKFGCDKLPGLNFSAAFTTDGVGPLAQGFAIDVRLPPGADGNREVAWRGEAGKYLAALG
ncbi:uncharacterized protein AMSG_09219 [Thecamonas trahens ATCC 50062]|uniref:Muniscin C-terminal domain-containing protein n=1 Tax=Thecamonas trahens ATCC 50062 TaxID=461836 RepID=A0A0L0DP08_THETB|nr:hypothetical protein AMSG_09219 [Thecamonas trahens ATCC 50062]KNC53143.1 hypothetical protein AMSG_09219 [Thecamonas trahens ATCC 50062]|eukprot:XP_013754617.1 hypothetical protein AMSG_09219 [Thecamonas trahens ATCC 50062]